MWLPTESVFVEYRAEPSTRVANAVVLPSVKVTLPVGGGMFPNPAGSGGGWAGGGVVGGLRVGLWAARARLRHPPPPPATGRGGAARGAGRPSWQGGW